MPAWQTGFSMDIVRLNPGGCMELVLKARPIMGIPARGTEWSARRFGPLVVVFAEWTLDDEVEEDRLGP